MELLVIAEIYGLMWRKTHNRLFYELTAADLLFLVIKCSIQIFGLSGTTFGPCHLVLELQPYSMNNESTDLPASGSNEEQLH